MRAVRFRDHGSPDVLGVDEIERPTPGEDEVLIRVRAAGINPFETYFRQGVYDPPALPMAPGSDFAGTVEAVGARVSGFEPGDRVFGTGFGGLPEGTYAEYVAAPAEWVATLPAGVEFEQAAGVGHTGLAAWQAVVHHGDLDPAETCLIHGGAGGVGHLAVQLASRIGATVVTSARDGAARDRLEELGADVTFDYRQGDLLETVRGLSPDDPDVIVDTHLDTYLEFDLQIAARGGRIVALQFTGSEGGEASIPQNIVGAGIAKQLRIQFVGADKAPDIGSVLERVARLMERGDLRAAVAGTYGFDEVADAHRDLEAGGYFGRLVFVPR